MLRAALLTLSISAVTLILIYKQWYITAFCLVLLIVAQLYDLIFYVEKTNRELSRFLLAIRHSDFTQRFSTHHSNPSFSELHTAFNEVSEAFQRIKADKEAHYQYLQAIISHIGIGILSYDQKGEVRLLNQATKDLLQVPHLKQVDALNRISPELVQAMKKLMTGESQLVSILRNNEQLLLSVRATELVSQGEELKIISLQNIRSEMEQQELEAWQKLIRVLTHEIMNSVTPVISLTSTISQLVETELVAQPAGPVMDEDSLEDIRTGLRTIEKRTKGMLHFVENYRKLTRVPTPERAQVRVQELFSRVHRLMQADFAKHQVRFLMEPQEQDLQIFADLELIEQVLINLVKNAMEACTGAQDACVEVLAFRDEKEQGRVRIDVKDNGHGIPDDVLDKIFVPFYTTKKQGSGIGLSLSRQIMRQHHGSIRVSTQPGGPTVFSLVF